VNLLEVLVRTVRPFEKQRFQKKMHEFHYTFEIIVPIRARGGFAHHCFINYPAYTIASLPSACSLNLKMIASVLSSAEQ
jgi:hypothetical protein